MFIAARVFDIIIIKSNYYQLPATSTKENR